MSKHRCGHKRTAGKTPGNRAGTPFRGEAVEEGGFPLDASHWPSLTISRLFEQKRPFFDPGTVPGDAILRGKRSRSAVYSVSSGKRNRRGMTVVRFWANFGGNRKRQPGAGEMKQTTGEGGERRENEGKGREEAVEPGF